jgi:hypothetical protein
MEQGRGVVPKAKSTRIFYIRRFPWSRGVRIDLKKSRTSPGAFMGVRLHPDLDESS